MSGNEIVKNETVVWEDGEGGTITAINMALNIHDLTEAEPFVSSVSEAFLMQRMASPTETSGLLITIIGKMQPNDFATLWSMATTGNEPVQVFMSQMVVADVVGFKPGGGPEEMIGVSLL